MGPQTFLPNCYNPNTQIIWSDTVYPLRSFNHGLASSSVSRYKLDWLWECLLVCSVWDQREECFCVFNKITCYSQSIEFLFICGYSSVLQNTGLKFTHTCTLTYVWVGFVVFVFRCNSFENCVFTTFAQLIAITSAQYSFSLALVNCSLFFYLEQSKWSLIRLCFVPGFNYAADKNWIRGS